MSAIRNLEQRLLYDRYGKLLWLFRLQPWHAAHYLAGVFLPPHERFWLGVYFSDYKENNVVASRGTSKCLRVGTKVIMADGSLRKVEDVAVGDLLMGPDSQPRKVLSTTKGSGPLYRVHQTSGMDYVVNADHVLSTKKSKDAASRKTGIFAQWAGDIVNIGVRQFIAQSPYVRDNLRGYKVGMLEFDEQPVDVDPYFLGLWLGDGCRHAPAITTADPEIIQFCNEFAEQEDLECRVYPHEKRKHSRVVFLDPNRPWRGPNRLWQAMRNYGITFKYEYEDKASCAGLPHNKRIPAAYIANTNSIRLQILAGLIDSDGNKDHGGYAITQKSEALARDIKYLADTLGFRTNIYSLTASCQNEFSGRVWRVSIGGDVWRIPCRIARKQYAESDLRKNKDWHLSQLDVTPFGEGEWAGFTVDGDHLFLLEDGTVTHNSYTHASLAAPLKALLYKNLTLTTLSASGFRGGKELFKDAGRMFDGQLRSQRPFGDFLRASAKGSKVIGKDPSMWEMLLRSFSRYNTVPTNNEEQLRGLRTNKLQIDERNTFPGEVVHKILRPMMNVGLDFRRPASGGDANQIYQVSTIDFTVRDWYPELQVAEQLQKREYDAYNARKAGDWEEYDRLMEENDGQLRGASYSYTRIDYTDLLIPDYITTLDGEHRYKVKYPREAGVELEDILRYDEHEKQHLYYTYPVDKKGLEEPLRSGTVDDDIWKAEQRNIFIRSSGNVFPYDLIQKIAERPIWQAKEAPKGKRRGVDEDDDGSLEEYFAPLLFTCGDPCVLGVDVARESDDISFVVIRLGELAEGVFDPFTEKTDEQGRTVLGKTPWNHICWAESHKLLQAHQVADKIREFYHRYNLLVAVQTPMRPRIAGLAMDKRGNGTAVRDELGNPKPSVGPDGKADPNWAWKDVLKIYDPEDDTGFGHYQALPSPDPNEYWGGMQLVATDNQDNIDWTFGARALMQQKKLYLAYWMPPSRWAWEKGLLGPNGEPDKQNPEYVKWEIGYQGIRRLKSQLLRLQTKISETGVIRFVMPGNRQKEEGKKDLWAGMIYAVGLARAHLVATTKASQQVPMIAPVVIYPEDMGVNLFGGALQRRI